MTFSSQSSASSSSCWSFLLYVTRWLMGSGAFESSLHGCQWSVDFDVRCSWEMFFLRGITKRYAAQEASLVLIKLLKCIIIRYQPTPTVQYDVYLLFLNFLLHLVEYCVYQWKIHWRLRKGLLSPVEQPRRLGRFPLITPSQSSFPIICKTVAFIKLTRSGTICWST